MSRVLGAALLGLSVLVGATAAQQNSEAPLTNTAVVKLVKAGFKDKTVIAIIGNRPAAFDLDPEQLTQLKREGVSENVILAMLSAQDSTFINADELSDDVFFKGINKPKSGAENSKAGENIFGSSGSSESSKETRGGGGGDENAVSSTGSAKVRIIKPPSTAAPQLEKTPTLNNEGVIRLVEAGFSEGTIIKRIEQSPVDFDLSPAKLDELFKRRVSDSIIAAMRAAMGVESRPK